MKTIKILMIAVSLQPFWAGAMTIQETQVDLSERKTTDEFWKTIPSFPIELAAQPAVAPRPKETTTANVNVQAVHNGQWIAFRLTWKDKEKSEGGKLGTFSDGVAMQFAVKDGDPPNIMMGEKGSPVHILHWKAQFQTDTKAGIRRIKEYYPNMAIDMYPMEYTAEAKVPKFTQEQIDTYSHGRAAGNAQSSPKLNGIDEIVAEGFGTSQVQQLHKAYGHGEWKDGMWSVVFTRPLDEEGGSKLVPGKNIHMGFAVWQGGLKEVGSRKSVTMNWEEVTWAKGK
jgi:hypothetical protein